MAATLVVFAMTAFAALIAAYAQLVFKKGVHRFDFRIDHVIPLLMKRPIYTGLALYAAALLIYLFALRLGQLSFVYPVFSASFIFVMLISWLKLREPMTRFRVIGMLFIALGILLVALNQ